MTTLYKIDNRNKIRIWKIWTEHDIVMSYIIVESGLIDGKLTSVKTPIHIGLGGKTAAEQAEFDMQTEVNKKSKDYVDSIEKLKEAGSTATINKPMKAEPYHPTCIDKYGNKMKGFKTLKQFDLDGEDFYIEPKIDGWRFRIKLTRNNIGMCSTEFYTASGDVTLEFSHISNSLIKSFYNYCVYQDLSCTELILDGEIYNHELGFQATASACGSVKHITTEKQSLRDKMQFHIFDVVHSGTLEERKKIIKNFVDEVNVLEVPSYLVKFVDFNQKNIIDIYFERFLEEGYEGLMIRRCNSLYEHKRSKNLIKYKPRNDEEFQVINFNESIETNTLGSLRLKSEHGFFDCNLMNEIGTDEYKKNIWDNREKFINKFVTVIFYGYLESGLPRQPYAKSFRPNADIS